MFCLNENGSVRFMKKFEYNPSCFIPYNSGKKILLNFLLKIVLASRLNPASYQPQNILSQAFDNFSLNNGYTTILND